MAGEIVLNSQVEPHSILSRTAVGAGWTIAWRFATRGIGFGSTLVLVRLLSPEDFGVVSLAMGFFQALDIVAGFGVEGAIIRADRSDREVYDAGFTLNVIRGVFTSLILIAFAGPVARFFGNVHLANVIYVLSAGWAVSAFENIGIVEFRRRLAFDMEFKIQIIPRVLALAVTIPAALLWHSYWALVAGVLATRIITLCLSYVMHPYRPWFGIAGIKHIFVFSFLEWVIGLLNLVSNRADTLIIGRVLGTAAVGVYAVGSEIAALPTSEIVAPLCRALFSGFVAARREGSSGTETLLRVLSLLAMLTFPLSAGLSLTAYPVVELVLGKQWLGAVPLVELLGIAAMLSLFNAVSEALFSAHAWLKSIIWMTAMGAALRLLLLVILIPRYGLLGGALAAAAMGAFQEAIYLIIGMNRLKIRIAVVFRSVARPICAVTIMTITLVLAGLGWSDADRSDEMLCTNLGLAVALGGFVYTAALLTLWVAAGRPAGAEADALLIINRLLSRR